MAKQDKKQPEVNEQPESAETRPDDAQQVESAVEGEGPSGQLSEPSEDALAAMEEELTLARDAVLRAQADAQNVMRRAEQDVEKARKFALERFCAELLPVVDNLERALEATSGDDEIVKPIAEGVQLTLKSFQDALKKFHIEAIDPAGEPFDPQLHQAMSMVDNPDVEPNTVIFVMQKGYTLNGRLVRPAMVMVSKTPEGA
ncbi:MAG: nucleotide exchange factor GrpE [Halioglobus sp.]|nr:nucleotide exchange factor GrpE [Halioglobus sp.]